MAISLAQLKKPEDRAKQITIFGDGGMGKTSLGALFPNPVIIPTEDGTQSLLGSDVAVFPLCRSTQDVFDAISALATEDHEFKTLVIDSITQFNVFAEHEVIASDPKNPRSINQALGGYGAGHSATSERHRQLREWAGALSEAKGMNIIYIGHADSETVDLPDQDQYTRYTLRLNKRSISHYSDNVDCVACVKLKTFTSGDGDRKKATTTGERIITCYPTPSHLSKNRFGIKTDLVYPEGVNPFVEFVPSLSKEA